MLNLPQHLCPQIESEGLKNSSQNPELLLLICFEVTSKQVPLQIVSLEPFLLGGWEFLLCVPGQLELAL